MGMAKDHFWGHRGLKEIARSREPEDQGGREPGLHPFLTVDNVWGKVSLCAFTCEVRRLWRLRTAEMRRGWTLAAALAKPRAL